MNRQKVKSSNISSVGYDKVKQLLEVQFTNEDVYQYNNVSIEVYETLISSASIGAAFHILIRGKYEFTKVEV
jgi:hypothetical protein